MCFYVVNLVYLYANNHKVQVMFDTSLGEFQEILVKGERDRKGMKKRKKEIEEKRKKIIRK